MSLIKNPRITKLFHHSPARDRHEEGRSATMLELFYDLIFVVAIAKAAALLHHAVANQHFAHGIISYLTIFFAIWWAWNGYSWFASTYGDDSNTFKLATMWQMVGAIIIAAGVKNGFEGEMMIMTIGYVVIRVSSVYLWISAAISNPERRGNAIRNAIGIFVCQIGWIALLFVEFGYIYLGILILAEITVPYWAESYKGSTFHAEHIEERLGLLTIIVLGETILASVNSISALFSHFSIELLLVSIGIILTIFGAWWIYFLFEIGHKLNDKKTVFVWGYGHAIIYVALAAIGAMAAVNVDVVTKHHATISIENANLAFAVVVAIYLVGLWFTKAKIITNRGAKKYLLLIAAVIVIGLGFLPYSVFSIGLLMFGFILLNIFVLRKNSQA